MFFEGCKKVPILELGISQLYLSESKLSAIKAWFVPDKIDTYEPLTVHDYGNGRYTLTDGHSRAFTALEMGLTHIPIKYDTDEMVSGELGTRLYLADIEWCDRFGLSDISCLKNRIVSDEMYKQLWQERCERSYNLLTLVSEQEQRLISQREPSLFLYGANQNLIVFYFEDMTGSLFELSKDSWKLSKEIL